VCPDARRDATAAAGPRELFHPDRVVDVVAALAPVLGLVLEPEEAEVPAAVVELARELTRLLPLIDVRRDLLGDEAADCVAQLLVLLCEGRQRRPPTRVLYYGDGGLQLSMVV
jgi:hypothetical protein